MAEAESEMAESEMAEAEMAEADLGPDELDRLEDALEELELGGALARWSEQELGPRVHARLLDYRTVLAATREALPLEDVPAGVLDGVLVQARQAATVAPAAGVTVAHEPWWTRLRRSFMVPALALAGTAMLVLWVFDPTEQATFAEAPASSVATPAAGKDAKRAEAKAKDLTRRADAPAPAAAPVEAAARAEEESARSDDAQGVAPEAEPAKDEAPGKPADVDAGAAAGRAGDAGGTMPGSLGGVAPSPAMPQEPKKSGGSAGPASGRWDIVSRGDRARQAGDCVAARDEYALALEDDEPRVRARAFAGLGLCDAAAGDEASADANYERARALDDEVASFIDSQSDRSRGADKKKRKPAPKKSKAVIDAFDDPL